MTESRRDDRCLYLSDGYSYMDGDEDDVNENGLFRADGEPATLEDFRKRYWTEPPDKWARQFPDYQEYVPPPMRAADDEQRYAESLIEREEVGRATRLKQVISNVAAWAEPGATELLEEIEVSYHGLPTLNGFAFRTASHQRYIIVHAGVIPILTYLSRCIVGASGKRRSNRDDILASLAAVAEYIGSSGRYDNLETPERTPLPYSEEYGAYMIESMIAIPFREAQLRWTVAHECAHHLCDHLDVLEADVEERLEASQPDLAHYRLRHRLEFEADRTAVDLIHNVPLEQGFEFEMRSVDCLLAFLVVFEDLVGMEYSEFSTHPSTKNRLAEMRRYIGTRFDIDPRRESWLGTLEQFSSCYAAKFLDMRLEPLSLDDVVSLANQHQGNPRPVNPPMFLRSEVLGIES